MQRECLVFIHILRSKNVWNVLLKLVRDGTQGRWLVSNDVEDEIQPLSNRLRWKRTVGNDIPSIS